MPRKKRKKKRRKSYHKLENDLQEKKQELATAMQMLAEMHALLHALEDELEEERGQQGIGCNWCDVGLVDVVDEQTGEVSRETCPRCRREIDRFIDRWVGLT